MRQLQEHRQADRDHRSGEGAEIELEKVEDMQKIMSYGILSTPGVVIDGQVVHAGGVPSRQKVEAWF
jgi:predicted thioredoxin/glutaredoxin